MLAARMLCVRDYTTADGLTQTRDGRSAHAGGVRVYACYVCNGYRLDRLKMAFLCPQFRHVKTAVIRPRTPPQAPSAP